MDAYLDPSSDQVKNNPHDKGTLAGKSRMKPLILSIWHRAAHLTKKRISVKKLEKLEFKLLQAGSPFNLSPVDFRLLQVVSVVGFSLVFGMIGFLFEWAVFQLLAVVLIGLCFGVMMPRTYLSSKIKTRQKLALKELPDFVDLLTVSLEAGLGFDSALSKVIEKQAGVLADEFRVCLDEIRLGKTRREGLNGIKNRLKVDEITTLLNSVIRAEKLGVGMVQVLRIQSVEVREKRKQRAEEQAMKAPIKMLFPLVLFIFPSLFIIILGPAVIQIINTFKGMTP
jgi:tight adherence protein C